MKNHKHKFAFVALGILALTLAGCSASGASLSNIHISEQIVGGSLSIEGGSSSIEKGKTVTITASPEDGYSLSRIEVNEEAVEYNTESLSYSFTAELSDYYVSALFSHGEYTIELSTPKDIISIGESMKVTSNLHGNGKVIYAVDKPARASIGADGTLTGISAGAVTVSAYLEEDESVKDEKVIFVASDYFKKTMDHIDSFDTVKGTTYKGSISLLSWNFPISLELKYDPSKNRSEAYEGTQFHINVDLSGMDFMLRLILSSQIEVGTEKTKMRIIDYLFSMLGTSMDADEFLNNASSIDAYCLEPGYLDILVRGNKSGGSYIISYSKKSIGEILGGGIFSYLKDILSYFDSDDRDSFNDIIRRVDGYLVYGDGNYRCDSVVIGSSLPPAISLSEDGYWVVAKEKTSFTREASATISTEIVAVALQSTTSDEAGNTLDTFVYVRADSTSSTFVRTTAADGTISYDSRSVSVSDSNTWVIGGTDTKIPVNQTITSKTLKSVPLLYKGEGMESYALVYDDGSVYYFNLNFGQSFVINSLGMVALNQLYKTRVLGSIPSEYSIASSLLPANILDAGAYFLFNEDGSFQKVELNIIGVSSSGSVSRIVCFALSDVSNLEDTHFDTLKTDLDTGKALREKYDAFVERNKTAQDIYSQYGGNLLDAIKDKGYMSYLASHWKSTYEELGSDIATLCAVYDNDAAPRPIAYLEIKDPSGTVVEPVWANGKFQYDLAASTTYSYGVKLFGFDESSIQSTATTNFSLSSSAFTIDEANNTFATSETYESSSSSSNSLQMTEILPGLNSYKSSLSFI